MPVEGTLQLSCEGAGACTGLGYCEMRTDGLAQDPAPACHVASTLAQALPFTGDVGLFAIAYDPLRRRRRPRRPPHPSP